MRQEPLYFGIGIFVFVAFLLMAASSFFLYNQYIHGKIDTYVMFFKGSLNGLDTTSAITYRGVKIGEVKRIELTANKAKSDVAVPVYVQFFVEKTLDRKDNPIQILIDKGMVASITTPNFLTGKASVELIPTESKQIFLRGRTFHGYAQFPTGTAAEDVVTANETLKTARKTLKDVSALIQSKEFRETITSIKSMADSINLMANTVGKTANTIGSTIGSTANTVGNTADALAYTANILANTLTQQMPGVLLYFNDSLRQISKAAYSTRNLTDYLSRHPESIIRGR